MLQYNFHITIATNFKSPNLFFVIKGSPRQFTEIEFTNRDAYSSHPCLRTCVKGEQLTCNYEFIVEQYETMSKACYSCPQNKTDCYRPHCVTGDGMKRSIIVVNRMMPGPIIEVK